SSFPTWHGGDRGRQPAYGSDRAAVPVLPISSERKRTFPLEKESSMGTSTAEKQTFLDTYDREHRTTMNVLRAYPTGKLDLRPHPKCRSAKELGWVFVLERGLGEMVFNDEFPEKAGG